MQLRQGARGFTLIELLVVVSIVVIISAASIPLGLNFVRNYQIMGAANGVAAQVQMARGQAVRLNTQRGVLLNFNYPQPRSYQWTSLEPNPMTGVNDTPVYPDFNPKVYLEGSANYGIVPAPPDNVMDPDPANGIMSPHGIPVQLPGEIAFDPGTANALLFRADGSVRAVTAGGPSGAGAVNVVGLDFQVTIRDPQTDLSKIITISRNGRVRVEE